MIFSGGLSRKGFGEAENKRPRLLGVSRGVPGSRRRHKAIAAAARVRRECDVSPTGGTPAAIV
jgi:hypothetical protein